MNFEAYLILVLILAIVILLSWKLWNFINMYAKFPKYSLLSHLVTAQVLRKIPPHIPFNSFFFQTLIHVSEKFRREGMFLVWGLQPHLLIFGEEAVKIFSNEDAALDKSYKYDIMRDVFGTGLLTSHTQDWKKQRKMLNPVFHVEMLKNKVPIFNKNADILVKKLKESINHPYINVLDYVKPCTFGAICEYIMGLEFNRPENKENIENYANMMTDAQKMIVYRIGNPWLHYRFIMNIIPSGKKFLKTVNDIHIFIRKVILEMKESIYRKQKEIKEDYPEDDEESRKSFSHILLDHHLNNPSFKIEDLESHVITFMAAGYESVAYTIMWCLFLLGLHPEVQEKAYNEVLSIPEGHIKYEDLISLKYLDCVIKETLRLYPTAPIYARRLNKEIQFGKYVVPKDTTVTFFAYALHRNPEVFPDPEKYNPERFMDGNKEKIRLNFIPFSEGIRSCIGKRFAMLEMKVVLAHILRHFWIRSLDRQDEVDLCWEIVLAPVKPLRFKLTPR